MQGGCSWGLSAASRGKDPKAHMALPTPHQALRNSGQRLDLLLGTCWRSSLRWGNTDSQHRGWRGTKGEDTQTRAIKSAPKVPAWTPVSED